MVDAHRVSYEMKTMVDPLGLGQRCPTAVGYRTRMEFDTISTNRKKIGSGGFKTTAGGKAANAVAT